METGNAIELKGVTKRFGDVIANDNVNLTVRKGEILSILGENGSGKTTLMNMLSGIYFPDEGEVYVDGKEVTIRSPKDSFALGIGMIHQHFKLINILTAAENIILGLPGKEKLNMKQVEKEIRELTEQYGFDLNPSQKIYDMSVSQKQTVEIVKVLYRGADILILDEPTAVLTPQETEKLFAVLRNMRKAGKSIIIITHKLNEVLELLQPYWSKDPDLSLLQILQKIADEAGFDKPVAELSDEVIIYHLKMHGTDKLEPIPGIKKDYEEDFKTALLKARGIIK